MTAVLKILKNPLKSQKSLNYGLKNLEKSLQIFKDLVHVNLIDLPLVCYLSLLKVVFQIYYHDCYIL